MMKHRVLLLILVILCLTLTACATTPAGPDDAADTGQNSAPPTGGSPAEPPTIADDNAAIQWVEPILEALMRQELNKPEGDIFPSELDHIKRFRLIGDTHIAINVNFGSRFDPHEFDSAGIPLKDGTYELDGQQYSRGSISRLADFANFRNMEDLRVSKNDLHDLKGLASLEKLELLRLSDCAIHNVENLAELRQIDFLDIESNQISDIAPLVNLEQLSNIFLGNNNISNLDRLSSLRNLQYIGIEYNPVENIDFIRTLEKLTGFGISGTKVEDISILAEKTDLLTLHLKNMDVKSLDLTPLTTLQKLRGLSVTQNQAELLSIQVIGEFKELMLLEIVSNDINISEEDIAWLREHLPHCQINSVFDLL
jgi:Leucine-rich repeat (LRR) protein/predicted small secreted protein